MDTHEVIGVLTKKYNSNKLTFSSNPPLSDGGCIITIL